MMRYAVTATRLGPEGSEARCKAATIPLDTAVTGREDAFNPAEALLAALAACMIKSAERAAPVLDFALRGLEVRLTAERQDAPPLIARIDYQIVVDTDEPDRRLDLLHRNIRKYGTISNTLAAATTLEGVIRRRDATSP
jgi:uncharacterized OsmC-like protein